MSKQRAAYEEAGINYDLCKQHLKVFFNEVFKLAFEGVLAEKFIPGAHLNDICDRLDNFKRTCTIGARMHAKSIGMYAKIAREVLLLEDKPCEIYLLSSNERMAAEHTEKARKFIMWMYDNGFLGDVSLNGTAKTIIEFKHNKTGYELKVVPKGVTANYRGAHPNIVICEDMLGEPGEVPDSRLIQKIETKFKNVITKMPKKNIGELHVMGNAQMADDLHFQIKDMRNPENNVAVFNWKMYPAILSVAGEPPPTPPLFETGQILWPQMYTRNDLLGDYAQGPDEFMTQFMCVPGSFMDAFFRREHFINENEGFSLLDSNGMIYTGGPCYVGYDPGKGKHPAHACLFEEIDGHLWQREEQWFEIGTDYDDQLAHILTWFEHYDISKVYWDDARAELSLEYERNNLPWQFEPLPMNVLSHKNRVSSAFKAFVQREQVHLLPYEDHARQLEQILIVNKELKAPETPMGHGDSFWTVGMACLAYGGEYEGTPEIIVTDNPSITKLDDRELWSKLQAGEDLFAKAN